MCLGCLCDNALGFGQVQAVVRDPQSTWCMRLGCQCVIMRILVLTINYWKRPSEQVVTCLGCLCDNALGFGQIQPVGREPQHSK